MQDVTDGLSFHHRSREVNRDTTGLRTESPRRGEEADMLVRDVLRQKGRRVIHIPPRASVRDALSLFVEHNIGSLPVVGDDGRLLGIFSERDVLFGLHDDCERFPNRRIEEVMTPDPVVCAPDEPVHEVMGKLTIHRVGQLPVMEQGKLIGVVSVGDLVTSMHEQVESENKHLLSYLYGST